MLEITCDGEKGVFFTMEEYEELQRLTIAIRSEIVNLQKELKANE